MASTIANKCKYELANANIDFGADAFQIILMGSGFIFDKDIHHTYDATIQAAELANGFGYVTGGETLAGVSVTEDDTNDWTSITWSNKSWTAAGGDIGPSPGAIIYDDTYSDTIVTYIAFDAEYTQADGGVATITNLEVRIA